MEQTSSNLPRSPRWLALGEAAELLGVHPSTLRRWVDDGDIRCMRTPGGHRRFREKDLQEFLSDQLQIEAPPDPKNLTDAVIHRARQKMQADSDAEVPWRAAFDDNERAARRESGRRLLGLAIRYTSRATGRDAILEEGRSLGREYGRDAAHRGLSLADTAQALLFFRETLVHAARPGPSDQGQYDDEDDHIHRSLQEFLDQVFYAALDAYEVALRDQLS